MKQIIATVLSALVVLHEVNNISEILKYERLLITTGQPAYNAQFYENISGDLGVIFIVAFFYYLLFYRNSG
jgi:hypothetical protein